MPLAHGARLGPYEIESAIGAGGMGEVYKARDTRLDRSVAIKILPSELSADPDRRKRFEREARAVAALNHPHICALHDVGVATLPDLAPRVLGGDERAAAGPVTIHYLVMEHLEGQTLADRLLKGKLPLEQALELAAQIADALDAAHKHGIIHRDLKPGNVMLTTAGAARQGAPQAKLLDFGLAKLKAEGSASPAERLSALATAPAPLTAAGTIVGTLQYMAPEQLEGKEADARTDLWALGTILYEMVTGKRAFEASSSANLIAAVLDHEPPSLSSLQPLTPPALERLVKKCLAKAPDDRWDSAHDVADELRWVSQASDAGTTSNPRSPVQRRVAWALAPAAIVAAALLGAVVQHFAETRDATPSGVVRSFLDVRPAEEVTAGSDAPAVTPAGSRTALTWTPDGGTLIFAGIQAGVRRLYSRRLDEGGARPVEGTEGARVLAVSPDGRWLAFWADAAIKKVRLSGGPPDDVLSGQVDAPTGLAWDAGGGLFVSVNAEMKPIVRVPAGGSPVAVTTLQDTELVHGMPSVLPDGSALLYTVRRRYMSWGDEDIVAQPLPRGEPKVIIRNGSDARYVATGHLVFLRQGRLFAIAFDPKQLRVMGTAEPLVDSVAQSLWGSDHPGAGHFAVSNKGLLAYIPSSSPLPPERALVSVGRDGRVALLSPERRPFNSNVKLSPDGRRLAVQILSLTELSLYVYDLDRGSLTLLNKEGESATPIWAPDGRRLWFKWHKDGHSCLAACSTDEGTAPSVVMRSNARPSSLSPTGRELLLVDGWPSSDILRAVVENGQMRQPERLMTTPDKEQWAEFSPDGRWLMYSTDASGRFEIYVQPYPGPAARTQVSANGGEAPAWSRNGREIFFVRTDGRGHAWMMTAAFEPSAPHPVGTPRPLFEIADGLTFTSGPTRSYDVSPDGQRFYVVQQSVAPHGPVTRIDIVTNWFEELKAKVPAGR